MTGHLAGHGSRRAPQVVPVTGLADAKRDSVRRVVGMLDDEADHAPTPEYAALWRRLAANTRREMISGD